MKQVRISSLLAALCLAVTPMAYAAGQGGAPARTGNDTTGQATPPSSMESSSGATSAHGGAGETRADRHGASQGSEKVRKAQQALNDKGHDAGPVDGIMGERTRSAVKEFQQAEGLPASGELDTQTVAALGAEATGASSSGSMGGANSGSRSSSGMSGSSSSQDAQGTRQTPGASDTTNGSGSTTPGSSSQGSRSGSGAMPTDPTSGTTPPPTSGQGATSSSPSSGQAAPSPDARPGARGSNSGQSSGAGSGQGSSTGGTK